MQTNFKEHFQWGVITCLAYNILIFNFNPFPILLKKNPCFLLNLIALNLMYLAGTIQPDLDLCTAPTTWPKIKVYWSGLALISFLVLFCTKVITLFAIKILLVFIVLGPLLIVQTWAFILEFWASLSGVKVNTYHRNSLFHSSLLWSFTNFLSLFWAPKMKKIGQIVKFYLIYFNSLGVLQHLFLDSFGSITTQKNFKALIAYILSSLILSLILISSGYFFLYKDITKVTFKSIALLL